MITFARSSGCEARSKAGVATESDLVEAVERLAGALERLKAPCLEVPLSNLCRDKSLEAFDAAESLASAWQRLGNEEQALAVLEEAARRAPPIILSFFEGLSASFACKPASQASIASWDVSTKPKRSRTRCLVCSNTRMRTTPSSARSENPSLRRSQSGSSRHVGHLSVPAISLCTRISRSECSGPGRYI